MFTRSFLSLSAAALMGLAIAGSASAQTYPRSIGTGEESSVEYGPTGPQGNILGGGRVAITGTGENAVASYSDDQYVQRPLPGVIAATAGSGENQSVVYVPAGEVNKVLSAR